MCGRYALYGPKAFSRAERMYFDGLDAFAPSYNVAPTDVMPVARLVEGRPVLTAARWGLVPSWAKDEKSGVKAINARGETCTSSPLFKSAWRSGRRCLVPANGFYEWKKTPSGKQPYFITSSDKTLLAFAGLWEQWRMPDGRMLITYTVITGDANDVVRPLHDRMPVIVKPEDYDHWLRDPDPRDVLKPAENDTVIAYPVSSRVGTPKNNDESLVAPVDVAWTSDEKKS